MDIEIAPSALKHGVSESDIVHAYSNYIATFRLDDYMTMRVGASSSGAILEIGVSMRTGNEVVVHAMLARRRYLLGLHGA